MDDIVKAIVQKDFKSGTSQKTGKAWSLHKYVSNSGKEFNSFDELEPGDTVRLTQNEYGWSGSRPRKADTQHDEVIAKLNEILNLLKTKQPDTDIDLPFDLED